MLPPYFAFVEIGKAGEELSLTPWGRESPLIADIRIG
jgi:hypothetical protein